MTRASHSAAPIVRMSRKTGSGGTYPQWMRTLEEKYQKLHKKITENVTPGNVKFSHATGRSVYDARLSHAIAKSREIVASRSFVQLKKRANEIEGTIITSKSDPALCDESNEHKNDDDKYLYSEDFNNVCDGTVDGCNLNELVENGTGRIENLVIDTTCLTSQGDEAAIEGVGDDENVLKCGEENNCDGYLSECPEHTSGENTARESNYNNELAKDLNRRNVKTSLSRTSKMTSKSCPAQIQSKSARSADRVQRTPLTRSKSTHKNSKSFTPMSEEAKHAITETIQEMRISTPNVSKTSMAAFVPSRTRKCVKTWNVPRKVSAKHRQNHYDANVVLENTSTCLQNIDHAQQQADEMASERSTHNSERGGNSLLPDIQNETKEKVPLPLFSYRLLGIGKYDIANHDTFEITPLGFDSRYNDVQPVEERESETPPPDIRQQAIEKCSEWLVKHNVK